MPTARPLTPALRALLAGFAGLALIAGFLLFPLAEETDRFFSWTIQPPLTAAFLGAAYWAAFVLIGWSASRTTWEEVVPAIVPVTVIAVLLLAATLIHLDKFDLDSLFGWFWLAVYCAVPLALALPDPAAAGSAAAGRRAGGDAVPAPAARHARCPGARHGRARDRSVGFSLQRGHDLAVAAHPLTARAVGAFLIGFAAAAAFAALDNRVERLRGAAYAYATLGALELLTAAIFFEDFDDGESAIYVSFAASVLLLGLAGSATVRGLQRS